MDYDGSGGIDQEEFLGALEHTADHLVDLVRTAVGLSRDQIILRAVGSTLVQMSVLLFLIFGIIALGSFAQFDAAVNASLTVFGAVAVNVATSTSETTTILVDKTKARSMTQNSSSPCHNPK